ncbi:unnamed protein product [Soboliphyme baturini]|uniref:Uncharacterized protein n=1 Tax=Soboliphyme baturini TaxID=241478 RepID=A0A3P8HQX0_9BILA|nr:unnamed protein product [Soboliphyme baturini]
MFSRFLARCSLQIKGETVEQLEKLKYLGVIFTSDGKFEEDIDWRIGVASGVLLELVRSTVNKVEQSLKTKHSVFNSIFTPMLVCGHQSWTGTENTQTWIDAAEMGFLRRGARLACLDLVYPA